MVIGEEQNQWCSRKMYVMVLICQFIGISNINTLPNNALNQGAAGYTLILSIFLIFLGIPLVYMEAVVGQFTSRDCIDVWKIRPCLSYIGYILVFWQMIIVVHNHVMTACMVHYFLISFENPIPFYDCGSWSTKDCNSLATNYTVNQDCIKYQKLFPYCENLYKTFPEYQYWRRNLLRAYERDDFYIAWRICLASALSCVVIFLACFKRSKSLKWFANIFAFYPMLALILLLMGSMRQKGLIAKYEEAIDLDFTVFKQRFYFSNTIHQVVYNLNIGSGVMFTLASTTAFRTPCFSDIVIAVVYCTVFAGLSINTIAMMTCPYAYEYGMKPVDIIRTPMSLNFEKIPRLLYKYQSKTNYLILVYSCDAILGISTSVVYLFGLLEILFKRCPKLENYPGLTTFCYVLILYIVTIPLLSFHGINIYAYTYRRYLSLFSTFLAILESLVFLIWYGIDKFSEDVHFMLGIKPNKCVKASWLLSVIFMFFAFGRELYYLMTNPSSFIYAIYTLFFLIGCLGFVFILRIVIAIFKKRFITIFSLDPSWGPKDDLLQRSRAMFSAQAMTKEYIYRQYSLQAGITARQQVSNVRKIDT